MNEVLKHFFKKKSENIRFNMNTDGSGDFDRIRVDLRKDSKNTKDAILVIENATASDQNYYECTARNMATGLNVNYMRVKRRIYVKISNGE